MPSEIMQHTRLYNPETKAEEARKRRTEALRACTTLRDRAHDLAVLSIQSERYRDDYEFREAVDAVLGFTQP